MRSSIRFSFVSTLVSVAALTGGCDSNDSSDPPVQYTDEGEEPASAPMPLVANVPVVVTNSTAQAVPTQAVGTTTVAGAVAATQAGTWNVSVTGGTVGASQSGAWSVGAKQEGPWTVDIGSSPPVSLAPGSSVSVWSLPPVTIAGVPAVNIANTPAVTIASMPAVAVSGTVLIGNTEDDEAIPVRNVGGGGGGSEATQTPWIGGGQIILGVGEFDESVQFATVPAGKRLVIEHITIEASVPAGQIVTRATLQTTITGSLATLRYPMQPHDDGSDTHDQFFSTVELTKVHVREGAGVIASVARNETTGICVAFFTLTGYLVDAD